MFGDRDKRAGVVSVGDAKTMPGIVRRKTCLKANQTSLYAMFSESTPRRWGRDESAWYAVSLHSSEVRYIYRNVNVHNVALYGVLKLMMAYERRNVYDSYINC